MPSADEWINKILYIRTTEYYVATKTGSLYTLQYRRILKIHGNGEEGNLIHTYHISCDFI